MTAIFLGARFRGPGIIFVHMATIIASPEGPLGEARQLGRENLAALNAGDDLAAARQGRREIHPRPEQADDRQFLQFLPAVRTDHRILQGVGRFGRAARCVF